METPFDRLARARDRFAIGDYHGAVLLLNEAILEGLTYADAFNLLALCLALIDRPAEALNAFDNALKLNPRYVEAHLNRAVLLADVGRDAEAQEAFETARDLGRPDETGFPVIVANRLANSHLRMGHEYRAANALDEAIAQYRRALVMRPGFSDVRFALARALNERGRHAEAAAALDAVLEVRPHWLEAMLLRGLCGYLEGDLDAADGIWRRAAERYPNEPRIEIYRSMLVRRRSAGS
ncbi:MAG: tetratricopeptide repeat protein [Gemmatimonadaceae bacterium]